MWYNGSMLSEPAARLVETLLPLCAFANSGEITCGVSGGADSLAMLVLALASGRKVTAVHVNHNLRETSADEIRHVEQMAVSLGAQFESLSVTVDNQGLGLEGNARQARFSLLPPNVNTGHTMDDQAETILINMLRGAGLLGLSGIRPGPEHPILQLRRAHTHKLCALMGLQPIQDPSNTSLSIQRNMIRHEVLPMLNRVAGRDLVPLLARQALLLRQDSDYLEELASGAAQDPTDVHQVRSLPPPLSSRVIRNWLRLSGATETSGGRKSNSGQDYQPPSQHAVQQVLQVVHGKAERTQLPGDIMIARSKGRLRLVRGGKTAEPRRT